MVVGKLSNQALKTSPRWAVEDFENGSTKSKEKDSCTYDLKLVTVLNIYII